MRVFPAGIFQRDNQPPISTFPSVNLCPDRVKNARGKKINKWRHIVDR